MKEIEKKDLPEVGGGVWSDDGCIPCPADPLKDPFGPTFPLPPDADQLL